MGIKRVKREISGKEQWTWVYDVYLGTRRVRTPRDCYFPTRGECEDAVSAIKADYRRGVYRFPSDSKKVKLKEVREYVEKTLNAESKAPNYVARMIQSLKVFESVIPSYLAVADLRTEHLEAYTLALKKDGLKDSTIRTKVTVVIVALNMAAKHFQSLDGWQTPRRPRNMLVKDQGRDRIITTEEEEKIIAAFKIPCQRNSPFHDQTRVQAARIFWLALRTGMREGELIGLRKVNVHFERGIHVRHGWIHVREGAGRDTTKTKRNRIVPMTKSVADALKEWINDGESEFVFSSRYHPRQPVKVFRVAFRRAVERAKLPYGRATKGGIIFHDTRHTAATRMMQEGASVRDVADILGHSDSYMTLRYLHSTPASKQKAIDLLEDSQPVQLPSTTTRISR